MADAESFLQWHELKYDETYSEIFKGYKEDGGSDKLADAKARCHINVVSAKEKVVASKRTVKKLQFFLRAMDKAHDNAMSFGHMLRREMDKIQSSIRMPSPELEKKVDEIIKASPPIDEIVG